MPISRQLIGTPEFRKSLNKARLGTRATALGSSLTALGRMKNDGLGEGPTRVLRFLT